MNLTLVATHTNNDEQPETQTPEPIRVIRKIEGRHQWVILKSEAELTADECRAIYTAAFGIYA